MAKTFTDIWTKLDKAGKEKLAKRSNISVCYLSQLAHGHRRAGANSIEKLMAADKRITFKMMRGDVKR